MKPHAVDWWMTQSERGFDSRTGYVVFSRERQRSPEDRPGKGSTVWDWCAFARGRIDQDTRGTAQNQLAARASIRKFIRGLPDKT